jgi:hypothetical protein
VAQAIEWIKDHLPADLALTTMQLSRTSVGLAVRTAREAARLTLNELAAQAGMTTSSLILLC